jgi:hypothetical protein
LLGRKFANALKIMLMVDLSFDLTEAARSSKSAIPARGSGTSLSVFTDKECTIAATLRTSDGSFSRKHSTADKRLINFTA